jgi:hypothetical protein
MLICFTFVIGKFLLKNLGLPVTEKERIRDSGQLSDVKAKSSYSNKISTPESCLLSRLDAITVSVKAIIVTIPPESTYFL